jgi:hypothetical protein
LRVRGTSTIAEFDISLFVKPHRRVHCLRSTGIRESTVNALRDRMGVRVGAPVELSSLDAASGSAIPARARSMDCPVLSRQSFQGSREFNPPYNVNASSRCATRTSRNRETLWRPRPNCATQGCAPSHRRGRAASPRHISGHPGIAFAGPLAQRDVPKHLREIDALVVPSLWFEN